MATMPAMTGTVGAPWIPVAHEDELPDRTSYMLVEVDAQRAVVIRGRDNVVRAFHNVCKHRGTPVLEEPCGTVPRIQCPYHAWIYDLEGRLVRAKHTEDLEDFDPVDHGLTPIEVLVADGVVHLRPQGRHPGGQPVGGLLTDAEIDAVRRPYRAASLLPGRAYHDQGIFEFEQERWFRRDWTCAGRIEEFGRPPTEVEVAGERLLVSAEGGLVAAVRPDSPGDPIRSEAWQGFLFVSLGGNVPPLDDWLGDLLRHLERFDFATLRRGHRVTYDVAANWKLIAENYSECYHCPGVHPQLNRLTPYDVGADYETHGAWQGGWMQLRDGFETMALGGARLVGPPICGVTPVDERRIDYLVVWPLLFLSVHPDYLLVHRLEPLGPGRTRITCDWLFEPATMAQDGFDPTPAVEFWDLTNRQDWHVCELQQIGTASVGFRAGRFSNNEPSVHAFDLMCVDRYRSDVFSSSRTVRERYDQPPP
jgi:Rieske 2Fe-2S family protein